MERKMEREVCDMVTVEERYEHLEKTIRGYNISADFAQIRAAYE